MPIFKTTHNILTKPWEDELFDPNWMDSDKVKLPPKVDWDYSRELFIEDIDVWEVLYQGSGGMGVYAAWMPYAEFYMITIGWNKEGSIMIETHYGAGAQKIVKKRSKELGMPLSVNEVWIEPEHMWLYEGTNPPNKIILI